jgi:hypothetical protein
MSIIAFYSYRSSAQPLTPESETPPPSHHWQTKGHQSTLVLS